MTIFIGRETKTHILHTKINETNFAKVRVDPLDAAVGAQEQTMSLSDGSGMWVVPLCARSLQAVLVKLGVSQETEGAACRVR